MARRTIVSCDRSSKEIEGEKALIGQPIADSPDLVISCPWYPELDGLTFRDLHDDERRVVANLLARIARKKVGTFYGYTGRELAVANEPGAAERTVAELKNLGGEPGSIGDLARKVAQERSGGAPAAPDPDPDEPDEPDEEPKTPVVEPQRRPVRTDSPDYVSDERATELELAGPPEDRRVKEGRDGAWYFGLDGRWWGPRTTQLRAERAVAAITEDRERHAARRRGEA